MSQNIEMGFQVMGYGLIFVFFALVVFYLIVLGINKFIEKHPAKSES